MTDRLTEIKARMHDYTTHDDGQLQIDWDMAWLVREVEATRRAMAILWLAVVTGTVFSLVLLVVLLGHLL